MAVDKGTLESGAKLVDAWGQLSNAALFGLTALSIGIIITVIIYIIFKYKRQQAVEYNKNKRAKQYSDSLKRLEDRLENSNTNIIRVYDDGSNKILDVLNSINENIHKVSSEIIYLKSSNTSGKHHIQSIDKKILDIEKKVESLKDSAAGIMNETDSALLVKIYFYKVIFNDCNSIIKQSLKENDYLSRSDFVSNKIRTEIGNVLSEARSTLSNLPISLNILTLFKIDSKSTSERFMLVDMIWSEVQELFTADMSLEDKYEESSLKVLNIIKDYVTEILSRELNTNSYNRMKSDFC